METWRRINIRDRWRTSGSGNDYPEICHVSVAPQHGLFLVSHEFSHILEPIRLAIMMFNIVLVTHDISQAGADRDGSETVWSRMPQDMNIPMLRRILWGQR